MVTHKPQYSTQWVNIITCSVPSKLNPPAQQTAPTMLRAAINSNIAATRTAAHTFALYCAPRLPRDILKLIHGLILDKDAQSCFIFDRLLDTHNRSIRSDKIYLNVNGSIQSMLTYVHSIGNEWICMHTPHDIYNVHKRGNKLAVRTSDDVDLHALLA